jgi:hypothetical protein
VCLEEKGRVVSVWGQQSGYTAQPEFFVTARGQTFRSLAHTDFLSWLIKKGYYIPHAVPNSSSFTAVQALANSFAVMNDPSLSASQRASLLATYYDASRISLGLPADLITLVPINISRFTQGPEAGVNSQTQQDFSVALWPDWRSFPPPSEDMAGNGWIGFFYTMTRPTGSRLWKITGMGTGP